MNIHYRNNISNNMSIHDSNNTINRNMHDRNNISNNDMNNRNLHDSNNINNNMSIHDNTNTSNNSMPFEQYYVEKGPMFNKEKYYITCSDNTDGLEESTSSDESDGDTEQQGNNTNSTENSLEYVNEIKEILYSKQNAGRLRADFDEIIKKYDCVDNSEIILMGNDKLPLRYRNGNDFDDLVNKKKLSTNKILANESYDFTPIYTRYAITKASTLIDISQTKDCTDPTVKIPDNEKYIYATMLVLFLHQTFYKNNVIQKKQLDKLLINFLDRCPMIKVKLNITNQKIMLKLFDLNTMQRLKMYYLYDSEYYKIHDHLYSILENSTPELLNCIINVCNKKPVIGLKITTVTSTVSTISTWSNF